MQAFTATLIDDFVSIMLVELYLEANACQTAHAPHFLHAAVKVIVPAGGALTNSVWMKHEVGDSAWRY